MGAKDSFFWQGQPTLADVTVARSLPSSTPSATAVAVTLPPTQPIPVTVPMPEEVRETYLEVQDAGTGKVV